MVRRWGLLAAPLLAVLAYTLVVSDYDRGLIASDLALYWDRGGRLLAGAMPYRDFPFEYGPLAFIPMLAPRLLWPFGALDLAAFTWCFTVAEGLLAVAVGLLIRRLVPPAARDAATVTWAVTVLLAALSVAWRFDLWPAALVLVALVAAERGRPGLAGGALAAGTLMKLFPAVVLPILLARALALGDRRGAARLTTAFGLITGGVLAAGWALAGPDSLGWLAYFGNRGLQIESGGASLLLALHQFTGQAVHVFLAFGSVQVDTAGAAQYVAVSTLLEIGLVGASWLVVARWFRMRVAAGQPLDLPAVAAATTITLAALLLSSKVFSTQYVVWFMPLLPFLPRRAAIAGVAVVGLSTLVFPIGYPWLLGLGPLMVTVLLGRNLVLTGLGLGLVARTMRRPAGRGSSGRTAGDHLRLMLRAFDRA
jgi:hypothetical protein